VVKEVKHKLYLLTIMSTEQHVSAYIGHHQVFYRLMGSIYLSGGSWWRDLCSSSPF